MRGWVLSWLPICSAPNSNLGFPANLQWGANEDHAPRANYTSFCVLRCWSDWETLHISGHRKSWSRGEEYFPSSRVFLFLSGSGWFALVPACSHNIIKRDTASPERVSMATSPSRQRTALESSAGRLGDKNKFWLIQNPCMTKTQELPENIKPVGVKFAYFPFLS